VIYGTGHFPTRDIKYVIRRDGVSSAYLYLGPPDSVGTRDWVEDLTEAAVFNRVTAEHFLLMFRDAFDGTVTRITTRAAARDHVRQVERDCVKGF
jgi:hypothetical protein